MAPGAQSPGVKTNGQEAALQGGGCHNLGRDPTERGCRAPRVPQLPIIARGDPESGHSVALCPKSSTGGEGRLASLQKLSPSRPWRVHTGMVADWPESMTVTTAQVSAPSTTQHLVEGGGRGGEEGCCTWEGSEDKAKASRGALAPRPGVGQRWRRRERGQQGSSSAGRRGRLGSVCGPRHRPTCLHLFQARPARPGGARPHGGAR